MDLGENLSSHQLQESYSLQPWQEVLNELLVNHFSKLHVVLEQVVTQALIVAFDR